LNEKDIQESFDEKEKVEKCSEKIFPNKFY
jgi:hypothetical protein